MLLKRKIRYKTPPYFGLSYHPSRVLLPRGFCYLSKCSDNLVEGIILTTWCTPLFSFAAFYGIVFIRYYLFETDKLD